ncbi:MAG: hypothetical protein LBR80_18345 [Deltaproteobacteria bacterium]|jgi:hypothetical protein|nr:hypothetical protein [Deltaproteobacteria bacterium]
MTAAEAEAGIEIIKASKSGADQPVLEEIAEKAGMGKERAMYLTSKLMNGFLLTFPDVTEEMVASAFGTPNAIPTAAEREPV